MATAVTTGVGRIVWGTPHERQPVIDDKTKVQAIHAQTGQPIFEYAFGLAIPKADFGPIWTVMMQEAAKVCNGQVPDFNTGGFAYKVVDGDSMAPAVPARGIPSKPYSDREGYAGCYVLAIKSRLDNPPPVFDWINNQWTQVDPNNLRGGNKLKTGDFVQVGLGIDGHAGQSPGLYLNPNGIQFVGFGTLIMRGPDANAMFGSSGPAALPAGASAAPVGAAPAGAAPPAMPGALPNAAPGAAPMPGIPAPVTVAGPSPAAPAASIASPTSPAPAVAPVTGFAAGQPQMPGMTASAPAPAPAPAPAAPPARVQAGTDANGVPYYFKVGNSGETVY